MFVKGKSRTVFFPSDTLIYAISGDSSKDYNIRTCGHMILGQLRMGARQTNYAPLVLFFIQFFIASCKRKTWMAKIGKEHALVDNICIDILCVCSLVHLWWIWSKH